MNTEMNTINFELKKPELAEIAIALFKSERPKGWLRVSRTLSCRFTPDGGLELERVEPQPSPQDPDGSFEELVEWGEGDKPSKK